NVLEIVHERIEVGRQAVGRRDRRVGVQRMNRETASFVDAALDVLAVFGAANPVLRREQPDQPYTGGFGLPVAQYIDVGPAGSVDARLIGESTDALAADEGDAVL